MLNLTAFKASIQANTNTVTFIDQNTGQQVTLAINVLDFTNGSHCDAAAAWYNLPVANFFAYYASVPISAIKGAINWKFFTPADVATNVALSSALMAAQWSARASMCDLCRSNVTALMSMGNAGTIDARPNRIVQGFLDALSNVPSAAGGAVQDAGWLIANGVQSVLCRTGTNAEKALADLTHGNGTLVTTPAAYIYDAGVDGVITGQKVKDAINLG